MKVLKELSRWAQDAHTINESLSFEAEGFRHDAVSVLDLFIHAHQAGYDLDAMFPDGELAKFFTRCRKILRQETENKMVCGRAEMPDGKFARTIHADFVPRFREIVKEELVKDQPA